MSALERVRALLAEAPGLERASDLAPVRLPVLEPFLDLLPDKGLRPGETVGITGAGATSLALALIARAAAEAWTAVAGLESLNLVAASELGVAIDRIVIVSDAGIGPLAAVVDAFDLVVARPALGVREIRKLHARVRERDAVLVCVGQTSETDLRLETTSARWHGLDGGHGHLRARTLSVTATGRGSGSRPKKATLWLPDEDGGVSIADDASILPLRRTG